MSLGRVFRQIDTLTMQILQHHKAYVDNANRLLAGESELARLSPEALLRNLGEAPETIRTGLRHNVGGHVNHSLFWQMMSPEAGGKPSGELAEAIGREFKSFEAIQRGGVEAILAAVGRGWRQRMESSKFFPPPTTIRRLRMGKCRFLGSTCGNTPEISESPSRLRCSLVERGQLGLRERTIQQGVSSWLNLRRPSIPVIRDARQDGVRAINLLQRDDQRHLVLESKGAE